MPRRKPVHPILAHPRKTPFAAGRKQMHASLSPVERANYAANRANYSSLRLPHRLRGTTEGIPMSHMRAFEEYTEAGARHLEASHLLKKIGSGRLAKHHASRAKRLFQIAEGHYKRRKEPVHPRTR